MKKSESLWEKVFGCFKTVLSSLLKIFHITLSQANWLMLEQFCQFVLVGCSNALVSLTIYYIVIWYNSDWYILGNALGYIAGIINSYFLNSHFVFKTGAKDRYVFLKMLCCYLTTYFFQAALLCVFINVLNFNEFLAPVLSILITTPINFIINKLWAFKH